jgi:hypothetical protein
MIFELRQYPIKPGQMERWVKYMDEVIVPYQASKGMTIIGNFVATEEQDLYIWIRRFESEEQRQALYKAVYQNERWTGEMKPIVDQMLDREKGLKITFMSPTAGSIIR